jgi:hypothetical protein
MGAWDTRQVISINKRVDDRRHMLPKKERANMSPSIEDNKIKILIHLRSTSNSHEQINSTTATALSVNVSSTMTVHLILRQPHPDPLLRGRMEHVPETL